ncbi:unnamed protein product [Phyllotreta striolata]|uniref:Uncharacterized protein n=1 Tax=Phyllotreta striolata TaxID=444603 RepID=A0A9N9XUF3_PHYSR|nr:unnamed protein product [Phyllotreta striolata]
MIQKLIVLLAAVAMASAGINLASIGLNSGALGGYLGSTGSALTQHASIAVPLTYAVPVATSSQSRVDVINPRPLVSQVVTSVPVNVPVNVPLNVAVPGYASVGYVSGRQGHGLRGY